MKHWHAIMVGFAAAFFGMVIRSALKNYANISM
jgi:hypothetical protein